MFVRDFLQQCRQSVRSQNLRTAANNAAKAKVVLALCEATIPQVESAYRMDGAKTSTNGALAITGLVLAPFTLGISALLTAVNGGMIIVDIVGGEQDEKRPATWIQYRNDLEKCIDHVARRIRRHVPAGPFGPPEPTLNFANDLLADPILYADRITP